MTKSKHNLGAPNIKAFTRDSDTLKAEVWNYRRKNPEASINKIAYYFGLTPDAVRNIIKIKSEIAGTFCRDVCMGSCAQSCGRHPIEM